MIQPGSAFALFTQNFSDPRQRFETTPYGFHLSRLPDINMGNLMVRDSKGFRCARIQGFPIQFSSHFQPTGFPQRTVDMDRPLALE